MSRKALRLMPLGPTLFAHNQSRTGAANQSACSQAFWLRDDLGYDANQSINLEPRQLVRQRRRQRDHHTRDRQPLRRGEPRDAAVALRPRSTCRRRALARQAEAQEMKTGLPESGRQRAPTRFRPRRAVAPRERPPMVAPAAHGRCACGGVCPRCRTAPQLASRVSRPSDPFEHEAARVAERVTGGPAAPHDGAPLAARGAGRRGLAQAAGSGQALPVPLRGDMETRFGADFGDVRLHTDRGAAASAAALNASAYTAGADIVFGGGQYRPDTRAGRRLLAHELTHVLQQRAAPQPLIYREPVYPDNTCSSVQDSINAAWPTARAWVREARRRLQDPAGVATELQRHFKIDPANSGHAADLATVLGIFDRMAELLDQPIDQRCLAGSNPNCTSPEGRHFAAFVHHGRPQDGIWHCGSAPDVGLLTREDLIEAIVHEVAHLADANSTDHAYQHDGAPYRRLTRAQAIRNADCYAELARDLFVGREGRIVLLGLSTGALLSSGRPQWVIGAAYDLRSRSGIEVFDLVGGVHAFVGLEPGAPIERSAVRSFGAGINFGFMSRAPDTHFFIDTRLGGFVQAGIGADQPDLRAGLSIDTLIGWADRDFRAAINLRQLYDVLEGNHAVIIGGQFTFGK